MSKPVKNINKTPTESTLKAALLHLLHEKPMEKITVKELCEKSNIYRSTFYSHYKSPEELLRSIENDVLEELKKHIWNSTNTTPKNVQAHAIEFLEYIRENDYTLRVLLFSTQSRTYDFFVKAIEEEFRLITKNSYTYLSEEYTPLFMSHGLLVCIMHWINTDYAVPAEELAFLLVHTLHSINALSNDM